MARCLITGASGFVGRAVMERLGRDYDVTGVSFRQSGESLVQADIRKPEVFQRVLLETKPDVVVHAAAYPDPDFCEEHYDEARRLNVTSLAPLCATLADTVPLVFISTDYVFDGGQPPYLEDSGRRPVNAYGRMKMEAEDMLRGRPNTIVARIALQVGGAMGPARPGFIFQMVEHLRSGREQQVDDVLVRFPTWTIDTAESIAFLLSAGAAGTFHVSGPRGATRYAWTIETARILGLDASHIQPSKSVVMRKAARPVDSQLITDKIRAMGYSGFTDFADVVGRVSGV